MERRRDRCHLRHRLVVASALALVFASAGARSSPLFGQASSKSEAQSPAGARVIARARSALNLPPHAVTQLHVEGTLPAQAEDSRQALKDMVIMRDAALAWRLTGDRAFLDQTVRYIDAWTSIYQISFNPIDETGFASLIFAYHLTRPNMPKPMRTRADAFLRRMASGYIETIDTGNVKYKLTLRNNWQSHRIKLVTLAAFELGDQDLIRRARDLFNQQIATNLYADGTSLDFEQRDALHYVVYDLEPLLTAALAAKINGQDWYSQKSFQGASLRCSLDWLATFARGERVHIEFVNSVVAFDRERAAAGLKEYQPHAWEPVKGADTFLLASMLDPRYRALSDKLLAGANPQPDWILLIRAYVSNARR
jgi:hypothetical protein